MYENRVGITFEVAPQQTIITTLPKPPLPILQIIVNVLTVAVFLIVVGHLLVTQCASRKLYRDLLPQLVKKTEKPLSKLDDLLFTLLGKYRDQNDKEIID